MPLKSPQETSQLVKELGGDIFTIETGYQEVHIFWSH